MLETVVLTRFVADFLWENKALSVLHAAAFGLVAVFLLERAWRTSRASMRLSGLDAAALFFLLCGVASYLNEPNQGTLIEFAKLASYVAFYLLGRVCTSYFPYRKLLAMVSLACVALMAAAALAGMGYQSWGDAITFAGGYFFKTDAALAALLFTLFVVAAQPSSALWMTAYLLGCYVVYMTNARIALPLAVLAPWLLKWLVESAALRDGPGRMRIGAWFKYLTIATVLMGGALYLLTSRTDEDALRLDLTNLLSEENTQGRTVIWTALWDAFQHYTTMEKLLGGGLDADVVATMAFSASDELAGARAHGTLPYLLISMGVLGTAVFAWLLWASVTASMRVIRSGSPRSRTVAALYLCVLLVFVWISLTVEAIIRAQVCVPLFLLMGLVSRDASQLGRWPVPMSVAPGGTPRSAPGQMPDLAWSRWATTVPGLLGPAAPGARAGAAQGDARAGHGADELSPEPPASGTQRVSFLDVSPP